MASGRREADGDGLVTLCLISPQKGVPLRLFCGRTILVVERDGKALANTHWRHQAGVFSVVLPKGWSQWRLRLGERQCVWRPQIESLATVSDGVAGQKIASSPMFSAVRLRQQSASSARMKSMGLYSSVRTIASVRSGVTRSRSSFSAIGSTPVKSPR